LKKLYQIWAEFIGSAFSTRIAAILTTFRGAWAPIGVLVVTVGALLIIRTWSGKSNVAADRLQAEMNMQHDRFSAQLATSTKTVLEFQARVVAAEKKRDELQLAYERDQRELANTQRALRETQRALIQTQDVVKRVRAENASLLQRPVAAGREAAPVVDGGSSSRPALADDESARRLTDLRGKLVEINRDLELANQAWRENHGKFIETWSALMGLSRAIDETEHALAQAKAPGKQITSSVFQAPAMPAVGRLVPPAKVATSPDQGRVASVGDQSNGIEAVVELVAQNSSQLSESQAAVEQLIRAIDEANGKIIAGQDRLKSLQASLSALAK
jgi:hypothetical protein